MLLFFPEHKIKYIKIPKNACSTIINSLGWSVVQDRSPHQFDGQFRSTDQDTSDWPCLAVIRDPYERLVSAYLNKLVLPSEREPFAGALLDTVWRNQRKQDRPSPGHSITFREFIQFVSAREDDVLDQHWQSQTHHLGGIEPTIVLNFKNLSDEWNAHPVLKDIPLRDFKPHATASSLILDRNLSNVDGDRIGIFRQVAGQFPPQNCFFDSRLYEHVRKRYAADFELMNRHGIASPFEGMTSKEA